MQKNNKTYPEGHFIGMWMAICVAIFTLIGLPLSIISEMTGFIGIGPAIGVAIGLSIGSAIEAKYKKEGKIRPLTEEGKRKRQYAVLAGIAVLTLGVIVFILLSLL